jgi:hypothetical protein
VGEGLLGATLVLGASCCCHLTAGGISSQPRLSPHRERERERERAIDGTGCPGCSGVQGGDALKEGVCKGMPVG